MVLTAQVTLPQADEGGLVRQFVALAQRLGAAQVWLSAALLLILFAASFEAVFLALEFAPGSEQLPRRQMVLVALPLVAAAMLLGHRLLRRRARQVDRLSERLTVALQAKQAAETANLAKARYLANVSHEIRSPLNAIYGYAQLVEQESEVRPQQAARVIRRCAEHMTGIVESLLDISRMENGLLRVRSEVVQLPEFLEQIVLMMRPAASAKGLDFIYEPPARVPEFVRTDQSRLRQALINLIGNAIKFTDHGSVTFRLHYRGQVATFEIADTGPGIAPEDHDRIFDPYERATGSGSGPRPGIGLGLPITKAIVQILGGDLELDSEPGRGACFRVILMLAEPPVALAPEAPHRRIIGYDGPRRSILIVDDDADQRGFVESYLAGCDLDVIAVGDGETALSLCTARSFDLAVLDITLPGISGWQTAARIRELIGHDIVIVMASANAHEFQHPEYDQPAHDHFIVKPFRLDDLSRAIGGLLNISWNWEATAGAGEPCEARPVQLPVAAHLHIERLRERIQIGHVRGIEAEITMLADAAPGHKELVDALYAKLDNFDLGGMSRLLESA